MDGAIVVNNDISRIVRTATQLVPDPNIETSESGTRHRTAERGVAKRTGLPVVSVKPVHAHRRALCRQADATSSRLKRDPQPRQPGPADPRAPLPRPPRRGDRTLLHRIRDLVTARDVAAVLQRMGSGSARRSVRMSWELGVDGRLLTLQLDELTAGLMDPGLGRP